MAQRDKFVIEMIVNVVMLIRSDENNSKIPFLDVNIINFLLEKNVNIFYEREIMDKLQRLRQGSMIVEEYRQKMELLLLRVGLREEERTR